LLNHENELFKLSKDKVHHWHDAHASFWLSRADKKRCWCNINEWTRTLTNSRVLISQSHAANHHVDIIDIVDNWLDQRFNQTSLNYVINLVLRSNSW